MNRNVKKAATVVAVGFVILSMICTSFSAFAKETNVSCVEAKVKEVNDIKSDMIQKAKEKAEAEAKAKKEAEEKAKQEEQKKQEEAENQKEEQEKQTQEQQASQQQISQTQQTATTNTNWNGSVLSAASGVNYGPSGKETYYNLDMSGVVSIMRGMGNTGEYWVRADGCKMLGDYIMVAANLSVHPRGSLVPTSLGTGIVCDTGGFAAGNANQLDIATIW